MERRLNGGYGAIFGSYWMIYGVVSSFASVFLLANGYSNSQIGITLAIANILAVIMQPAVADFVDRSKKVGVIETTEVITAAMMVVTVGMFIFKGETKALCLVFVLLIAFHTVLQPLFNSLSFRLEECGVAINYGIARSVGSLAYSIFVAILGTMVDRWGIMVMPLTGEITCLMLVVSLILTGRWAGKALREREKKREDVEKEEITLRDFIRKNRMFFLVNVGVVGLFFSNSVLNNYMAQIVTDIGGTTEDMGRILAVMAFLEIPTMVYFSRLKRRFSCQFLLKVASVGFTVKIALCWMASSVTMLYVAHIFQLVSFALFLPGMVYFTEQVMRRGEAVKGQALYTTMVTIATIFASLAGGWILDMAGAKMLTLVATIATGGGAALIIAVIDRVGKEG